MTETEFVDRVCSLGQDRLSVFTVFAYVELWGSKGTTFRIVRVDDMWWWHATVARSPVVFDVNLTGIGSGTPWMMMVTREDSSRCVCHLYRGGATREVCDATGLTGYVAETYRRYGEAAVAVLDRMHGIKTFS